MVVRWCIAHPFRRWFEIRCERLYQLPVSLAHVPREREEFLLLERGGRRRREEGDWGLGATAEPLLGGFLECLVLRECVSRESWGDSG